MIKGVADLPDSWQDLLRSSSKITRRRTRSHRMPKLAQRTGKPSTCSLYCTLFAPSPVVASLRVAHSAVAEVIATVTGSDVLVA